MTDLLYYVYEDIYRVFTLVHIVGNLINCSAWQYAARHMSLFEFVQCHLHILLHCVTVNTMNLLTTSKEADGRLQLLLGLYTLPATTYLLHGAESFLRS